MKTLNLEQEKRVLQLLKKATFIDNGASRCVYECPEEVAQMFDLEAKDYIIKLACGLGGVNQTKQEVECFRSHPYAPLAEIVAYGRYVEIMEKVDTDDFRDFAGGCYDGDGVDYEYFHDCYTYDDKEEGDSIAEAAYDVIIQLHDIFGHTEDNGQLGWNKNGDLVAYDYGFTTSSRCCDQTSDISYHIENDPVALSAYINTLCALIEEDLEMLRAWEDKFLDREQEIVYDNRGSDYRGSYGYIKYHLGGYTQEGRWYENKCNNLEPLMEVAKELAAYAIIKRYVRVSGYHYDTYRRDVIDTCGCTTQIDSILADINQ